MNRPLDLDLLRSFLKFLDRQQHWALSIRSSQRIHSLIQREFETTAPYFVFEELRYRNNNWKYKINKQSEAPSNSDEFNALLTKCKFIRSRYTYIYSDDEISLDFLKSVSHVWAGQKLTLNGKKLRPSPQLYRLISTSAGKLMLLFPGAFSVLSEPFIREHEHYINVMLVDETFYNPSAEFPYQNFIIEFLFASDINSRKELYMDSDTTLPSIQHRSQIVNAVKQRLLSALNAANFDFTWICSDAGWGFKDSEIILNHRTNQHLISGVNECWTNMYTLAVSETPKYSDEVSSSSSSGDDSNDPVSSDDDNF